MDDAGTRAGRPREKNPRDAARGTSAMRLLRPLLAPTVGQALGLRFDAASVRGVLGEAFDDYEANPPSVHGEPAAGGRLMIRLAALTVALYRSLLRRGLTEDEARSLTARVTSSIYAEVRPPNPTAK